MQLADIQLASTTSLRALLVYLQKSGRINEPTMYEKAIQSFGKSLDPADPTVASLTEDALKAWIDTLMLGRSHETITRYVTALCKIYRHALTLGLAEDKSLPNRVKEYVAGLSQAGFDKGSRQQLDAICRLAQLHTEGCVGKAVDVVLYSFYNAAMSISDVISLRSDAGSLSTLPHAVALRDKYAKETRKYVFPLQQWQQSTNTILASVDKHFRPALRMCGIDMPSTTIDEFVGESWVMVAKMAGLTVAEICACCPTLLNNPKLQTVNPAHLTPEEIYRLKLQVANRVVDMSRHWYAIRFAGDERRVRDEIERCAGTDYARVYYPVEEIYKKTGKKLTVENRPSIRNVLFVQTLAGTIASIQRHKAEEVKFAVIKNNPSDATFAIIPDSEMHRFSIVVSNGHDIIGDKELSRCDIEVGHYVRITEGMLKGYAGRVLKITRRDNSRDTVLQIAADSFGPGIGKIFGKHLNISVPDSLVALATQSQPN